MTLLQHCPRCRAPLTIPQPPPAQIGCFQCSAVIHLKAQSESSQNLAPTPITPAGGSRHNMFILGGLLGGLVVVAFLAGMLVGLTPWHPHEDAKKLAEQPVKPQMTEESPPPTPLNSLLPTSAPAPSISPKIQTAIDRGVAHLKKRLREKNGAPYSLDKRYLAEASVGALALSGLALLEARVEVHDPLIQETLALVRRESPKLQMVYAISTCLFFLNRLHEAEELPTPDRELVRSLALRLVAGQLTDGRWTYLNPPINAEQETELVDQLTASQYTPRRPAGTGANSMAQFAMLALWGCQRHELPVRPALLAASAYFRRTQHPEGTWGYAQASNPSIKRFDSNTCAGLLALAMERTLLEDLEYQPRGSATLPPNPKTDEQCARAFTHLAGVIGRTRNDPTVRGGVIGNIIQASAWGDYYFLWSLERVAVIYDLKKIGGKDWYAWGSRVILENQREDGSWLDRHGDVPDTCFALLFLTRANLAKDLTQSIRTRNAN